VTKAHFKKKNKVVHAFGKAFESLRPIKEGTGAWRIDRRRENLK